MANKTKRKSNSHSKPTPPKRVKEAVDSRTPEKSSGEATKKEFPSKEALISWLLKCRSSSQVNAGLQILYTHLSTQEVQEDVLNQIFSGWMTTLMKILEFPADDLQLILCCNGLNVLMLKSLGCTEIRKDALQSLACKILHVFMEKSVKCIAGYYKESTMESLLLMVKTCVKYLGASSLPHMNKLESFLIKFMLSNQILSPKTLELAYSTYSYLPRCGGVALRPETYSKFIRHLLAAAEYCSCNLLSTCCHIGGDLSLPDVGLPLEKAGGSVNSLKICHQQLMVYMGCLEHLLRNINKTGVTQIAVRKVIQLVCGLTSIGVNSRVLNKSTGEIKLFKEILPGMIGKSLLLLATMFKTIGGDMMLYRQTVSQLLIELVQDYNGTSNTEYDVIRTSLYKLIMSVFGEPACISVLYDKQLMELILGLLLNYKTGSKESLAVLEQILLHCGRAMSSASIQALFSWLTTAAMNMKKVGDLELRYLYYRCLKSSLHCSNRVDAPLTHISVKLLSAGVNDNSQKVRSLCLESLHSDSMLSTQPVYASPHQYPSVVVCEEQLETLATPTSNSQPTESSNNQKTAMSSVGTQTISDNVRSDKRVTQRVAEDSTDESSEEDENEETPDQANEQMDTNPSQPLSDEASDCMNNINSNSADKDLLANGETSENIGQSDDREQVKSDAEPKETTVPSADAEPKEATLPSADVSCMLNDFVDEESDHETS